MSTPTITWTGKTGKTYQYLSMSLPYSCNPGQDGNYIFCKIVNYPATAKLRGKTVYLIAHDPTHRLVKVRTDAGEETYSVDNLTDIKPAVSRWLAIYIGEGDLNDRANDVEHYSCAVSKGATHVHVHLNRSEQARLEEEQDLLASNQSAYAPTGCNQKSGG